MLKLSSEVSECQPLFRGFGDDEGSFYSGAFIRVPWLLAHSVPMHASALVTSSSLAWPLVASHSTVESYSCSLAVCS